MSITICVNSISATLSTVVNGKDYVKKVKSNLLEYKEYEVSAILKNLSEALRLIKKEAPIKVVLYGTDTINNVVKATKFLKAQSYKEFNTKDGKAIFMQKEWVNIFPDNSLPLSLLRKGLITFEFEYYYKKDPNFVGD